MPGSHLEVQIRFGHRWWLAQREIYSNDNEHGEVFQRHMDKYHPQRTALNLLLIFTLAVCSVPSMDILMNICLALCILEWEDIQLWSLSLTQYCKAHTVSDRDVMC